MLVPVVEAVLVVLVVKIRSISAPLELSEQETIKKTFPAFSLTRAY